MATTRLSSFRRCLCSFRPPSRSILSQRIEAAAREGNVDQVRAILREHDAHQSFRSSSSTQFSRPSAVAILLGYSAWNFMASAYDYRILGREAAAQLEQAGGGQVTVQLHLKSFAFSSELSVAHEDADGAGSASDDDEQQGFINSSLDAPMPVPAPVPVVPRRRVRTIPHVYITDALFGRSQWVLNCRKGNGHTAWFTSPDDGDGKPPEPGGGGFSWSSSSSWRS